MKKIWPMLALAVLVGGCGPTIDYNIKAKHQYARDRDYSRYRTFQWVPLSDTIDTAQFDRNFVTSMKIAFTEAIEAKGLKRTKDNPDVLIALYAAMEGKIISSDWGYNYRWDSSSWSDYWMERRVSAKEVGKGTIVLDILDTSEQELVWTGTASEVILPEAGPDTWNKRIDEAVEKILSKYPPPAGGK